MIVFGFFVQLFALAAIAYAVGRVPALNLSGMAAGISPLEILKVRYARGEISQEAFEDLWLEYE